MLSQWKTWPWRGTTHLEKVQPTANEISHLTHSRSTQVSKMGLTAIGGAISGRPTELWAV